MKKSLAVVAVFILAIVTLVSCSFGETSKEFEENPIKLVSKGFDIAIGETTTAKIELTQQLEEVEITATSSEGLRVLLEDNNLTLIGDQVGEYLVNIEITAKGYTPYSLKYPATVSQEPQDIAITKGEDQESFKGSSIELAKDDGLLLELLGAEQSDVAVTVANPEILAADFAENKLTLKAIKPGETTLLITATKEGYADFSKTIDVTVTKAALNFTLSATNLSSYLGQPVMVQVGNLPSGATVTASVSNGATAKVSQNQVTIESVTEGSYTATITCSADGYEDSSLTVTYTATKPVLPITVTGATTIELSTKNTMQINNYQAGDYSLSTTGGITASLQGSVISVEATKAGAATITLTANVQGYATTVVKIDLTVSEKSYPTAPSGTYANEIAQIIKLTNQERSSRGLSTLSYAGIIEDVAAIRAKEASQLWSHTRPNGSDWITAFADYSLDGIYISAGENLFSANTLSASLAVEEWMNSQGHRENILRTNFNSICVAITKGSDGNYYYSQIFMQV